MLGKLSFERVRHGMEDTYFQNEAHSSHVQVHFIILYNLNLHFMRWQCAISSPVTHVLEYAKVLMEFQWR